MKKIRSLDFDAKVGQDFLRSFFIFCKGLGEMKRKNVSLKMLIIYPGACTRDWKRIVVVYRLLGRGLIGVWRGGLVPKKKKSKNWVESR